jgi:hypothetical protein
MGSETDPREYDEETIELLHIWHDWEEFGLLPFKRDDPDLVITYYKNALRHISGLRNQAEANKNKKGGADAWIDSELQKQGKQPRKRH